MSSGDCGHFQGSPPRVDLTSPFCDWGLWPFPHISLQSRNVSMQCPYNWSGWIGPLSFEEPWTKPTLITFALLLSVKQPCRPACRQRSQRWQPLSNPSQIHNWKICWGMRAFRYPAWRQPSSSALFNVRQFSLILVMTFSFYPLHALQYFLQSVS